MGIKVDQKIYSGIRNFKIKVIDGIMIKGIKAMLVKILYFIVCVTENINLFFYSMLFKIQWHLGSSPDYMDHNIDLYYLFKKQGKFEWMIRGCWNALALENFKQPEILELGCGDGFNCYYFYRNCKRLIGCDISDEAIKNAKRKYSCDNIQYLKADFKENMPEGHFTNVIWDASMNYFSIEDIEFILKKISVRLDKNNGILSGVAVAKSHTSQEKKWTKYAFLFENEEALEQLLKKYFDNVNVNGVASRENEENKQLYFWASNRAFHFKPI